MVSSVYLKNCIIDILMYHKIKAIYHQIKVILMGMAGSFKQNNLKEAENEIESACQLRKAVLANDLEAVNRAINDHANVNMVLVNQQTALHLAASNGYNDILRALIHAPDVNLNLRTETGHTPIHLAVEHVRTRSVRLLIDAGADINIPDKYQQTALHTATAIGDDDKIVRALIRAPDVNLNIRTKDGNTPLHFAVARRKEQSLRLLIDAGADINISDNQQRTALHLAASNGYDDILRALIDAPDVNLNLRTETGHTPLHLAVEHVRTRSVRLLIDAGADINIHISGNDQFTALHIAAHFGHDDIVRALIDAPDVNLNSRDEYGNTPLHVAIMNNRKRSAQLLVNAGADINISISDHQ